MSRTRLILMLSTLLWITACSDSPVEPAVDAEMDVIEAAVRYEIETIDTTQYDFFTLAQMKDAVPRDKYHAPLQPPVVQLVARIRNAPVPYREYEECSISVGGVTHADFEGKGWLVWTASATVTGSATAVVYAGYFISGLGAKGELLQLKRENGTWRVRRASTMWIS